MKNVLLIILTFTLASCAAPAKRKNMGNVRIRNKLAWLAALALSAQMLGAQAQEPDIAARLGDFDAYMEKTLADWNAPGIGVGIVVGGELVFARGYGYRDYGKQLPFTPQTLMPIASNSKLFTAVAAGMLVEEGKLTWDKPVRQSVPAIEFYNDHLNNNITLRDMLSHRTGLTRHDSIWYKSGYSREVLFDRIRHMEPKVPMRHSFLYNNMMYAAVGQIIEIETGKSWEEYVQEHIFNPLGMDSTVYTIAEMLESDDYGAPWTERRDSHEIYEIPYYEDTVGVAPAGAIISNIEEVSHWLVALLNDGQYDGKQVLPARVLKETLQAATPMGNALGESRGFWEILNSNYGMGRWTASYRGHLLSYHGGDLGGFHSQVSLMPNEDIGVIVFVIGDHARILYNVISYQVYERLLEMELTPWSERWLEVVQKGKQAGIEGRAKAGEDRIAGTTPSHALEEYSGRYENPGYGIMEIDLEAGQLQFKFHEFKFPMSHFHYDRFDTPDDERDGKWSVNFITNPQGDVDKAMMSLDEAEAMFTRLPESLDPGLLAKLSGDYETATGYRFKVVLKDDGSLVLDAPGQPEEVFVHYKDLKFRFAQFADIVFEFFMEDGEVSKLTQRTPSGEFEFTRKPGDE